jgi:hypothetical protein
VTTPALAVPVRGKGRHYRHPETGDLVPSVTNVIGCLDKPALIGWAAREVAAAAWDARHSLTRIPDRDMAVDMLKAAPYKKRNRAADVGTLVHAVAEALASDSPLPVFGNVEAPYLDAFLAFVADHDVKFHAVEVTVFHSEHRYAGTYDFLADVDGRRVIGDHKTGSGIYPEVALQLAALRWADEAVVDGMLCDHEMVDGCVAVHLQPGGYGLHEVRSDETAFAAFCALRTVWEWHKGGLSDGCVGARS